MALFQTSSVKVSYSDGIGTYIRFGDYQALQVASQYSGIGLAEMELDHVLRSDQPTRHTCTRHRNE